MKARRNLLAGAAALASALSLSATAPAVSAAPAKADAPRLIIVISVDQYSGDLFAQYRAHYSGGLKRLTSGVVFPRAYQGHAITETCPGHSTILTGSFPARTGIIANMWYDRDVQRPDKVIYCTEDPAVPGSTSANYQSSPVHLKVPTFGDRLKAVAPSTRVVSVSGKDRAAILMGGPTADQTWWWDGKGFSSYAGRPATAPVERANGRIAKALARPAGPRPVPELCAAMARPLPLTDTLTVGEGRFEREAGDGKSFRGSPALDEETLAIAGDFAQAMKLGRGSGTDVLIVGLSATDVVGHRYGPGGQEMCIQQFALDRELGKFFDRLDRTGVDYLVVLTADHGGHDLPERSTLQAQPAERRASALLSAEGASEAVARATGLSGALLWSEGPSGDVYVTHHVPQANRARVVEAAYQHYAAQPEVAAVFRGEEIAATPMPTGTPEQWSLLEKARLSYHPGRSGDLMVLLKPSVTPVVVPRKDLAAMHGSPWEVDRRVPLLFWRKGLVAFEQPLPVQTVDILPTLAAQVGLSIADGEIDGRCLDILAGDADSCR